MLKKIEETRKQASILKERRESNEKAYLDKLEHKRLQQMHNARWKEGVNKATKAHRSQVKLNKMYLIESKQQSTKQMRNVSKLTVQLKH